MRKCFLTELATFLEIFFCLTDFSNLCDSNLHSTTYICGFRWFTEKKANSCLSCEKLKRILIFPDFSDHFTSFRAVRLQNSLQQTIILKTPNSNFHASLPPLHTLSLPLQPPLNPQHHTPTPPFASIHRSTRRHCRRRLCIHCCHHINRCTPYTPPPRVANDVNV